MRQQTMPGADGTPLAVRMFGERRTGDPAILLVHGWARSAAYDREYKKRCERYNPSE